MPKKKTTKKLSKATVKERRKEAALPVNVAAETLIGDLREICLQELKVASDIWQKLGERDQVDAYIRVEHMVKRAVRRTIEIIASRGRVTARATVDQVVFKDGAKIVLKAELVTQAIHEIADLTGRVCLIVIPTAGELVDQETPEPKVDKDQKELEL